MSGVSYMVGEIILLFNNDFMGNLSLELLDEPYRTGCQHQFCKYDKNNDIHIWAVDNFFSWGLKKEDVHAGVDLALKCDSLHNSNVDMTLHVGGLGT